MPCVIRLVVRCAKGLPVDEEVQTYVEASLHDVPEQRTGKNTKGTAENPVWNETLTLEVSDDLELQDYPLLIECKRAFDDDVIGSLTLDFGTLLQGNHLAQESEQTLQGWFPLFETLSGIQGVIFVTVKFRFVDDRGDMDHSSSIRVKFFSISSPPQPESCDVEHLFGLVEVLKVVQDPEYHWRDLIRSSRASNNERLSVFKQISLQARRSLAKKVIFHGGNAVLGYREQVDLEGDITDRICIRAYGTAAFITTSEYGTELPLGADPANLGGPIPPLLTSISDPGPTTPLMKRLNTPPRGNRRSSKEVDLITLDRFPMNMSINIAGTVSVRAVKLLGTKTTLDKRQQWWQSLRDELRSNAHVLGCDHVVGFNEQVAFHDELVILSVMGTAATLEDCPRAKATNWCHMVHKDPKLCVVKGQSESVPCQICGEGDVGSFLCATIDVPEGMPVIGQGALIEARVVRSKRDLVGDAHASEVSEALPFLELELHKTLLYKLKARCMNAAFGLRVDISVGETVITGVATGTGIFCAALPKPSRMKVTTSSLYTLRYPDGRQTPTKSTTNRHIPMGPTYSGGRTKRRGFRNLFFGLFEKKRPKTPPDKKIGGLTPQKDKDKDTEKLRDKLSSLARHDVLSLRPGKNDPTPTGAENMEAPSMTVDKLINDKLDYYTSLFPTGFHEDLVLPQDSIQYCASFDYSPTKLKHMWREMGGGSNVFGADALTFASDDTQGPLIPLERAHSTGQHPHPHVRDSALSPVAESVRTRVSNPNLVDMRDRSDAHNINVERVMESRHTSKRHDVTTSRGLNENMPRITSEHSVMSNTGKRDVFVFEIEDATDEDLIHALLDDPPLTRDMAICNTDCLPGVNSEILHRLDPFQTTMLYGISRVDLTEGIDDRLTSRERGAVLSQKLGKVMNDMYTCMLLKHELRMPLDATSVRGPLRCCLSSVSWRMHCVSNDTVELVLVGHLMAQRAPEDKPLNESPSVILVSPLSAIPTRKVQRHFGLVSVHMIKETTSLKRGYQESLQVFYHQFLAEALWLARAHVSACQGNALLGFRISNLYLRHVDKRRAYAVLNILGDAVLLGPPMGTSCHATLRESLDTRVSSVPQEPRTPPSFFGFQQHQPHDQEHFLHHENIDIPTSAGIQPNAAVSSNVDIITTSEEPQQPYSSFLNPTIRSNLGIPSPWPSPSVIISPRSNVTSPPRRRGEESPENYYIEGVVPCKIPSSTPKRFPSTSTPSSQAAAAAGSAAGEEEKKDELDGDDAPRPKLGRITYTYTL